MSTRWKLVFVPIELIRQSEQKDFDLLQMSDQLVESPVELEVLDLQYLQFSLSFSCSNHRSISFNTFQSGDALLELLDCLVKRSSALLSLFAFRFMVLVESHDDSFVLSTEGLDKKAEFVLVRFRFLPHTEQSQVITDPSRLLSWCRSHNLSVRVADRRFK